MSGIKHSYFSVLSLRFLFTLLPQTGYIHPDEFFQVPEVVYGDILKIKSLRTWEFSDQPIRNIAFPYVMTGIPAMLLSVVKNNRFFPYLLLVLPRIMMCLLSLIQDLCLYKICILTHKNPYALLLLYSSSYVTLVYLPRTFTNTLEGIFFSVLIYFVISKSVSPLSKVSTQSGSFSSCFLGLLISSGCFLRPTFLFFAFVPTIVWFFMLSRNIQHLLKKILLFTCTFIVTSFFYVCIDTLYYEGELNFFSKQSYHDFKHMVFTPLNFISYNFDPKNLSQHGHHPKYLHLLVNIPLLFTTFGIYTLWKILKIIFLSVKTRSLCCSKRDAFFLFSFLTPVLFLSLFSHQEPRFLIPLLTPLFCLFGEQFYNHLKRHKFMSLTWMFFNMIGFLFFGFIHQGGLVPCLSYFQNHVINNQAVTHDLVFFHTYMPPQHLLAVPKTQKNINIHDLAGNNDIVLMDSLQNIFNYSRATDRTFVIIPGTMTVSLVNLSVRLQPRYKLEQMAVFFPHFNSENLPVLYNLWMLLKSKADFEKKLENLKIIFSLHVYEVVKVPT